LKIYLSLSYAKSFARSYEGCAFVSYQTSEILVEHFKLVPLITMDLWVENDENKAIIYFQKFIEICYAFRTNIVDYRLKIKKSSIRHLFIKNLP